MGLWGQCHIRQQTPVVSQTREFSSILVSFFAVKDVRIFRCFFNSSVDIRAAVFFIDSAQFLIRSGVFLGA